MPDFKCAACRIRLRSPGGDATGQMCPVCEAPLELVGELSEVVGFRSIDPGRTPAEGGPVEPLARPISDLTKRREARIEQSRMYDERWVDDDGRFDPEAVAAALERLPPKSDA